MSDISCGICLDDLKTPVSTPCGHIHCEKCLIAHMEANSDAMSGSCPSCRAVFPIATPDLRFVPMKYHKFILPSVRRIFLDSSGESSKQLKATVTRLEARVDALQMDKKLLIERCESAMAASHTHAEGERDVRLEKESLMKEMHELKKKYENLKGRYKELKTSREESGPNQATKRDSTQAALDSSSTSSSTFGPAYSLFSTEQGEDASRPILRIPKRPRLLGSPFDPTAFRTVPAARPVVFKKGRASVLLSVDDLGRTALSRPDDDDATAVNSSGGPQRSGLPTGDLFSPDRNKDSNTSRGSIRYGFSDEIEMEEDE